VLPHITAKGEEWQEEGTGDSGACELAIPRKEDVIIGIRCCPLLSVESVAEREINYQTYGILT